MPWRLLSAISRNDDDFLHLTATYVVAARIQVSYVRQIAAQIKRQRQTKYSEAYNECRR